MANLHVGMLHHQKMNLRRAICRLNYPNTSGDLDYGFPLKLLGVKPFRDSLEEKILLARYFYEKLSEIKGFELGAYPDLSVVYLQIYSFARRCK